jgi:pyruvate ferredoxin oxidoreductase beta subunit
MMERFTVFVPKLLPRQECFLPGSPHSCKGCAEALAIRHVYKGLGSADIIEKGEWKIPWKQSISDLEGPARIEMFLPALLRIPKTGERVLSICFDNEACTDNTVRGKEFWKKHMPAVAIADGIPYVATACPSYPFDLMAKVKEGYRFQGDAYIHVLCPCPVGWGFESSLSIKIGKLAVESNLFPLYEVVQNRLSMSVETPKPRLVKEYFRSQERFKGLSDTVVAEIQCMVSQEYEKLKSTVLL